MSYEFNSGRRCGFRRKITLSGILYHQKGECNISILNVSETGAFIETEIHLNTDSVVEIEFDDPRAPAVRLRACISRKNSKRADEVGYGIEFLGSLPMNFAL